MWLLVYTVCLEVSPARIECITRYGHQGRSFPQCHRSIGPMKAQLENDADGLRLAYLGVTCERGRDA